MKIIIGLFLICSALFAKPLTVGVPPFANNSLAEKEAMQPLSKGLADMMTTGLAKVQSLKLIERADLQKIVRELGLSMSGMVDESSLQEAGKLLGADMLLIGGFNHSFGGDLRIDARLVRVETGETVKAVEVTGSKKKLFRLVNKLSFKITRGLDLKLSKKEKKSLKRSDNQDLDALLCFSQGLDAEDQGDYALARDMYEKALRKNKKYTRARERLKIVKEKIKP
jgi:TolB-like protein